MATTGPSVAVAVCQQPSTPTTPATAVQWPISCRMSPTAKKRGVLGAGGAAAGIDTGLPKRQKHGGDGGVGAGGGGGGAGAGAGAGAGVAGTASAVGSVSAVGGIAGIFAGSRAADTGGGGGGGGAAAAAAAAATKKKAKASASKAPKGKDAASGPTTASRRASKLPTGDMLEAACAGMPYLHGDAAAAFVLECSAATSLAFVLLGSLRSPQTVFGVAVGVRVDERLRKVKYLRLCATDVDDGGDADLSTWRVLWSLWALPTPAKVCFNFQARCVSNASKPSWWWWLRWYLWSLWSS